MAEPHERDRLALLVFALCCIVALVATRVAERLPAVVEADAAPERFAEARTRPLLERLVEAGPRVPGSVAHARASAQLVATLAELPGVEVDRLDVQGSMADPDAPQLVRAYRAEAVLARLPGRRAEAIMISAHYDSPGESPGAADDGIGVVTAVEVLRALAAGPQLERTIIVNLNGAEESGTLGAHAFLAHPWRDDVIATINLEGTPRGRSLVFEAGPASAWLLAHTDAIPRPHASGVAEDMFRTGLLGHYTDFRIYAELAAIPTIDIATYGDFWAYHTALDRPERVEAGVIQHMGDTSLALARSLAQGPAPTQGRALYTDLLGVVMLRLRATTGLALAGLGLVLALGLTWRGPTSSWSLLRACALLLLAMLAALALPALVGLVVASGLDLPHRWYASPTPGVLGFVLLALAAGLGTLALARRELDDEALFDAALVVWLIPALLACAAAASSGLLLLMLALPAALARLGARRSATPPRWPWALALLPGMIVVVQQARIFTTMFVAEAGLLELPFAFDPVLAATLGLPVALLLPGLAPLVPTRRRCAHAAMLLAGLGLLATLLSSLQAPYSVERPKRVFLVHGEDEQGAWLRAAPYDAVALSDEITTALALSPAPLEVLWFDTTHARPLEATGLPDPRPRVRALEPGPRGARVRVELDASAATDLFMRAPPGAIVGWSLDTPPTHVADADTLLWVTCPPPRFELELELAGHAPVELEFLVIDALGRSPALERALAALPAWTTPHTRRYRAVRVTSPASPALAE